MAERPSLDRPWQEKGPVCAAPARPVVAIMMDAHAPEQAIRLAHLLIERGEGLMMDASPAGHRTLARMAQAAMVQAMIDLAPGADLAQSRAAPQHADNQGLSAHEGQSLPYVAVFGQSVGWGEDPQWLGRAIARRLNMRRGPVALVVEEARGPEHRALTRAVERDLGLNVLREIVRIPAGAQDSLLEAAAKACAVRLRADDRARI